MFETQFPARCCLYSASPHLRVMSPPPLFFWRFDSFLCPTIILGNLARSSIRWIYTVYTSLHPQAMETYTNHK